MAGSSFPNSFQEIKDRGVLPISERFMFDELVRTHNAPNMVYGDWGSTRPPSDPVPMVNVPRLDIPGDRRWTFVRAVKGEEEDYQDVAIRAIADSNWPDSLDIWGTYLVRSTAEGLPTAIRSPVTAASARINIHLYTQAYFDLPNIPTGAADEPFTDDI